MQFTLIDANGLSLGRKNHSSTEKEKKKEEMQQKRSLFQNERYRNGNKCWKTTYPLELIHHLIFVALQSVKSELVKI